MAIQLDFFQTEKTDVEYMIDDIKRLDVSQHNLRKGLFQRHSTLAKQLHDTKAEVDCLKGQIEVLMRIFERK